MISVAIIEDNIDFNKGLEILLNASEGFLCSETYFSAEDGIRNLSGNSDVLLLDINLPHMTGIEAIPIIKNKFPHTKIIMLTIFDDDDSIIEAILGGADGYLLKKTSPPMILNSITECLEGGSPMTGSIARKVLTIFKKFIPAKNDNFSLTKRELEILNLIVGGIETSDIASKLYISIQTVRNHIRHIYEKLQVHSKSQAVVKAIKEGLV